jgi:hypothetical protein
VSAIPENAIIWKLKSINAITAIVGTRIFPRMAKQGTLRPYIIVDRTPGQVIPQFSSGPSQLNKTPLTIYCIGSQTGGYKESRDIGRLVQSSINPAGVTGSVQWNGTWIDHCWVIQTYDSSSPPVEGDEVGFPIEAIDCLLFHLNCDSAGSVP